MKILPWLSGLFSSALVRRCQPKSRPLRYMPLLERLESRCLLSAFYWTGDDLSGSWQSAGNWNQKSIPGAGDDVFIVNDHHISFIDHQSPGSLTVQSVTFLGGVGVTLLGGSSDSPDLVVTEGISGDGYLAIDSTTNVSVKGEIKDIILSVRGTLSDATLAGLAEAGGIDPVPLLDKVTVTGTLLIAGGVLKDSVVADRGFVQLVGHEQNRGGTLQGSVTFVGADAAQGAMPTIQSDNAAIKLVGLVTMKGTGIFDCDGGAIYTSNTGLILESGVTLQGHGYLNVIGDSFSLINHGTIRSDNTPFGTTSSYEFVIGPNKPGVVSFDPPASNFIVSNVGGVISSTGGTVTFTEFTTLNNLGTITPNPDPTLTQSFLVGEIDIWGPLFNFGEIIANRGRIVIGANTDNKGTIKAKAGAVVFRLQSNVSSPFTVSGGGAIVTETGDNNIPGYVTCNLSYTEVTFTQNTLTGRFVGGNYDDVTIAGEWDLFTHERFFGPDAAQQAQFTHTVTLDAANITLHGTILRILGDTAIVGQGSITLLPETLGTTTAESLIDQRITNEQQASSLQIGSEISISGRGGIGTTSQLQTGNQFLVENHGQITAVGGSFLIYAKLKNYGVIESQAAGALTLNALIANYGTIAVAYPDGSTSIAGTSDPAEVGGLIFTNGAVQSSRSIVVNAGPAGELIVVNGVTLRLEGDLLGNVVDRAAFQVNGTLRFDRAVQLETEDFRTWRPQLLEAMGIQRILGKPESFDSTFVSGNLTLANRTLVKLVDNSVNNPGNPLPDAVYVDTLNVPVGTILDLNGYNIFVRAANISGQVINGTITPAVPPPITQQPASVSAQPHQSATFSANAKLFDSVQWFVSQGNGLAFVAIPGATSTTLTVNDVRVAMEGWRYQAAFTNVAGTSSTDPAMLHLLQPSGPPESPSNLLLQVQDETHVGLSWSDQANNEDSFLIERSTDSTNWTQVAVVGANITSYVDSSASPKTIYYYRVRTHNLYQDDSYSTYIQAGPVTTPEVPPTANAYRDAVLASTPSGYWRLGESAVVNNTVAVDSSGNGYNGRYYTVSTGSLISGVAGATQTDANSAVTFAGTSANGAALVLPEQPFGFPPSRGLHP
jgi:hypothetical protein